MIRTPSLHRRLRRHLLPVLLSLACGLTGTASGQGLYPNDESYRTAFLVRCTEAAEAMARMEWNSPDTRVRNYLGIAKLATGIDAATGLKYLEDAVADPKPVWGCFEVYAFMEAVER